MHFRDRAIIISKKFLKENSSIITVFTENHGLYSGVIKQYGKKNISHTAEGNLVDFFWSARLHEHIGTAKCELIKSYNSHIIMNKTRLYAFNSVVSIIKQAFHERDSHNNFFPALLNFLEQIKQNFCFRNYIELELSILAECGYRLELKECTVTGRKENLYYVSPKSGCAVSKEAGKQYADKLLLLPQFFNSSMTIDNTQKSQALKLTGYFFERYILQQHKSIQARSTFIHHILDKENRS